MVKLNIKRGDTSLFLYETDLDTPINDLVTSVTLIHNGRLKVERICSEMQELAMYGTLYPPEILGLTEEQVVELKLKDTYGDKCVPSGGWTFNKDPIGRRNGRQPNKAMQDVINKTVEEAKEMISKKLVLQDTCLTLKTVQRAIDNLRGAVMIVYPMKLPPHDVIRHEFENIEDLAGTQASLEVIDPTTAELWFCGKLMERTKNLNDYLGRNNKCKLILKLQKKGQGAPAREPVISEAARKELMLHAYRRQEELKKLAENEEDEYLNAEWADNKMLKRSFQGLNNISWKPK